MTARLERLRWWHVEQAVAIEEQVYRDDRWSARTFWSELAQLDTRHYVGALDAQGALVGYAGLCDYPDEAWVQTVAVAPAAQGQGLGALLLGALLTEARRRRATQVVLEVAADNEAAQRLYARAGFRRTGVRRGYYQPSGTDALVMTLSPLTTEVVA